MNLLRQYDCSYQGPDAFLEVHHLLPDRVSGSPGCTVIPPHAPKREIVVAYHTKVSYEDALTGVEVIRQNRDGFKERVLLSYVAAEDFMGNRDAFRGYEKARVDLKPIRSLIA
ncbi:MAG TPA: hypothetical protein GXX40_08375 [Firmicutes bacterium]|nr:hypothetical protein [Bacillota bacterium]